MSEQGEISQSLITQSIQSPLSNQPHSEKHISSGEYLKSTVYGGVDGVVNTLTVIIGGIASGTHASAILAIGIAVLIGDGLGMGLGDYLSAKAEKQFIKAEEQREYSEVKYKLDDQKEEVRQIYTENGYSMEDASKIADLYSSNDQAFVNIMMLEQLGLVVDDSSPRVGGLITFGAFVLFGLLPLLPYIVGNLMLGQDSHYLLPSLLIGGVELFSLGFSKAVLIGVHKIKAGTETFLLGGMAVAIGYLMGLAFKVN